MATGHAAVAKDERVLFVPGDNEPGPSVMIEIEHGEGLGITGHNQPAPVGGTGAKWPWPSPRSIKLSPRQSVRPLAPGRTSFALHKYRRSRPHRSPRDQALKRRHLGHAGKWLERNLPSGWLRKTPLRNSVAAKRWAPRACRARISPKVARA